MAIRPSNRPSENITLGSDNGRLFLERLIARHDDLRVRGRSFLPSVPLGANLLPARSFLPRGGRGAAILRAINPISLRSLG